MVSSSAKRHAVVRNILIVLPYVVGVPYKHLKTTVSGSSKSLQ